MISGYYLCLTCKRSISKVLNLYAIAVLFSLLLNVASSIVDSDFSIIRLLKPFVVGNYFLLLYSAVYILSPYVNKIFDNITKESFLLLLVFMSFLFSIYPTFIEYLFGRNENLMGYSFVSLFDGDGHGYTLVNFMFMYTIGAYFRKYGMLFSRKSICLAVYIISSIIIALVMHFIQKVELNYFSPICIISAIAFFNFFALLKPVTNKAINYLSSTVFGIFIVHNFCISQLSKIVSIKSIVDQDPIPRICGILLFAFSVFVLSIMISIVLKQIIDRYIMPLLSRIESLSYEVK